MGAKLVLEGIVRSVKREPSTDPLKTTNVLNIKYGHQAEVKSLVYTGKLRNPIGHRVQIYEVEGKYHLVDFDRGQVYIEGVLPHNHKNPGTQGICNLSEAMALGLNEDDLIAILEKNLSGNKKADETMLFYVRMTKTLTSYYQERKRKSKSPKEL